MRRPLAAAAILVVLYAAPLAAQPEPSTAADTADRPGFADGARVLGGGRVQIESGVLVEHVRLGEATARTLTWPQAQFRVGLSSRVDASVWWDGFVRTSTRGLADPATTGEADPRVGGKLQLLHREAVDLALVGSVGLPVGGRVVSSGDPDPLARLSWSVALTPELGLAGTLDVAEDRRDGAWRARPAIGAALNRSFGSHVGTFAGLVVEDGDEGSSLHVWSAEAGVTGALGPHRQIDVWGGRRLSGGDASWFVGGGLVQRVR